MYTIIDKTYFVGEVLIPGWNKTYIADELVRFINEHQKGFLIAALGYPVYKAFWASVTTTPNQAGRWRDLVEGTEWTKNGIVHYWKGLRQSDIKESVIAKYVYIKWMTNHASESTQAGEAITEKENAKTTTAAFKGVRQWNVMIKDLPDLWQFLQYSVDDANARVYPEFHFKNVDRNVLQRRNNMGI